MRARFFIIVGVCIAACSLASLPVGAEESARPTVSVIFTVVGWTGETVFVAYKNNGKTMPFQVTPFTRSEVYSYTGPAEMEVFTAPRSSSKPVATIEKIGVVIF